MNRNVKKLAESTSAIDAIRQDLIRCGFELEFHELNGVSRATASGGELDFDAEPDYDLLRERSREAWLGVNLDDIEGRMSEDWTQFARIVCDKANCNFHQIIDKICSNLKQDWRTVYDQVERDWREDWEDDELSDNASDYYPAIAGDVYKDLVASRATRSVIDCGDDNSVRGGEIRTEGALTPFTFLSAAADLLDSNEFTVDNGCSFHIHLSVPSVRHQYGTALQAEMTAYLLENIGRMPESVQQRIRSQSCRQWAMPKLSEGKYTAVHCHRQGTWEFRIFGNVSEASEARRCLILAIEAMRHAYRVKLGLSKTLVGSYLVCQFNEAAKEVLTDNKISLSRSIKQRRIQDRQAA